MKKKIYGLTNPGVREVICRTTLALIKMASKYVVEEDDFCLDFEYREYNSITGGNIDKWHLKDTLLTILLSEEMQVAIHDTKCYTSLSKWVDILDKCEGMDLIEVCTVNAEDEGKYEFSAEDYERALAKLRGMDIPSEFIDICEFVTYYIIKFQCDLLLSATKLAAMINKHDFVLMLLYEYLTPIKDREDFDELYPANFIAQGYMTGGLKVTLPLSAVGESDRVRADKMVTWHKATIMTNLIIQIVLLGDTSTADLGTRIRERGALEDVERHICDLYKYGYSYEQTFYKAAKNMGDRGNCFIDYAGAGVGRYPVDYKDFMDKGSYEATLYNNAQVSFKLGYGPVADYHITKAVYTLVCDGFTFKEAFLALGESKTARTLDGVVPSLEEYTDVDYGAWTRGKYEIPSESQLIALLEAEKQSVEQWLKVMESVNKGVHDSLKGLVGDELELKIRDLYERPELFD